MIKDLINLFAALFLGGLLIAITVKVLRQDINVDLTTSKQITGRVVKSGVTTKMTTVAGRMKRNGNVFFIHLDNSDEVFATYRPGQDYTHLLFSVHPGDTITIYYRPGSAGELNLDVYQITKDGHILQDYETYNRNHKYLIWLSGIGGLVILFAGVYPFIKRAKQNKHKAITEMEKAG